MDSSVRGIYNMLQKYQARDLQKKLEDNFGKVWELDYAHAYLNVAIGELKPEDQPKMVDVGVGPVF